MQASTKPYVYYEQIINGLFNIPKNIQSYLGNVILVKNERDRANLANEKSQIAALPHEDGVTKSTFGSSLFGWFSKTTPPKTETSMETPSETSMETPSETSMETPSESHSKQERNGSSDSKDTPSGTIDQEERYGSSNIQNEFKPTTPLVQEDPIISDKNCHIRTW
jgi:hypothetical protein